MPPRAAPCLPEQFHREGNTYISAGSIMIFSSRRLIALYVFLFIAFLSTPGFCVKLAVEVGEPLLGREIPQVRDSIISKALQSAMDRALGEGKAPKISPEDTSKFIKGYKILEETLEGEQYKMTVEVNIDSRRLKKRLDQLIAEDSKKSPPKPSIYLNFTESPGSDLLVKMIAVEEIQRNISIALIGSGYLLKDRVEDADASIEISMGVSIADGYIRRVSYVTLGTIEIKASLGAEQIADIKETSRRAGADPIQGGIEALRISEAAAMKKLKLAMQSLTLAPQPSDETATSGVEILVKGVRNFRHFERIDEVIAGSIAGIEVEKRVFSRGGNVLFTVSSRLEPGSIARAIERLMPGEMKLETGGDTGIVFGVSARKK
ncbi:MAG: hypothetical protein ACT4NX_03060 [Deltaproteobacteria bacterium]